MSSSGVIYAIIVGAWAVYLVPMWLRREDELNRARQTQRYAAAIKVLAHKEAFERRWAKPGEAEEALPLAAGQGVVAAPRTVKRATGKGTASEPARSSKSSEVTAAAAAQPSSTRTGTTSTGNRSNANTRSVPLRASTARRAISASVSSTAEPKSPRAAARTEAALRSRTGLMARRRRVVAILFAVSTLGALVSADLGVRYLWAMAVPAVLLSAYIARLRRDERIRVAARAAKRVAAQQAREADLARVDAERRAEAAQAKAQAEAAREDAQAEAEQRRRTEAARRRASAAARSRAQAFAHEAPDQLRQASNG